MNLSKFFSRRKRVYVDTKILGMHDATLQRLACVGYVVEGSDLCNARQSSASETDDAEIDAILFAISDLKQKIKRFTVICDHQSVVSDAKKGGEVISKNSFLNKLRKELDDNRPVVELAALKSNPAHGYLTIFVNKQKLIKNTSE